jgi:PHD/YefM family antitoxin component YafN of YafNO toxin-antitoxin module
MAEPLRRVRVTDYEEFRKLLRDLKEDHIPRVIEEDGEPVAVLLDPADYPDSTAIPKSRVNREKILSLIGSWEDLDADKLIEDTYRWREESPPSPDPATYFEDEEPKST